MGTWSPLRIYLRISLTPDRRFPEDVNQNERIGLEDVVFLVNCLYSSEPAANVPENGNANCGDNIDLGNI
ncbi:MAG: hypothetical protein WBC88_09240, partial [Candidatus Zixiibacteriota bacterium]